MVTTREVYYVADGLTMVAHLARPDGDGPWPAVLIGHDGIGLDDYQRGYADDLAGRGYVAMVMEYHGGRWYADLDALLARVLPLIADPGRMRVIGRAALEILLAEPGVDPDRLAGFGFGAGGSIVLELARRVSFRAVAAVHPALPPARSQDWVDATAAFLLGTGSEDSLCTPDQLLTFSRALQDAGADWRVNVYGGAKHGFWHPPVSNGAASATEPDRDEFEHAAYHPVHAQGLWDDVVDLFADRLSLSQGSDSVGLRRGRS